ncbi:hypothetical protein [Paenibacillus segetis]|uniref:Uncharacterized protein n=1 Tax=Paenibacillus segetis TaxID=1325360 RepID=A0ABQ1YP09_9BACL|nr:hypothetical protein [Paenibacillus segetis]GGH33252.1 hypothetical protein GCM10008013_38220 [Paenibacillus segetis]
MGTEVRISQYTAILLEHAKRAGMSEESLLNAVNLKDVSAFNQVEDGNFKYNNLFIYSDEHGEKLAQAICEGYRINFNTNNGLKNWLEQALGLQNDVDFKVGEGIVEGLCVTEENAQMIGQRLAANWVVANAKEVQGGKELTLKLRAPEISI